MARKKNNKGGPPKPIWMLTFSDLVTVMLTFFVLVLSMATMDREYVREIVTVFQQDVGFLTPKTAGRLPDVAVIMEDILDNPWDILEKEDRIKDLLFPEQELPPEVSKSTLEKNLEILMRPEGIALMMTGDLLFPFAETTLQPHARQILDQLIPLVKAWPAPVNVAGYTDNIPGIYMDNYEFAAERAMAVAEYFIINDIEQDRLSVSAYGEHFPVGDNDTERGRARNRRVEVLLKKTPGAYM
ncbi:flagellar motor protein MotB [Desulfonatronospira sp.]|uniref:OmpA/MotB family protein n=1 Tax=Desulfonatronospira sp. TaxID=1962951 RepID=UPI0025C2948A|nr:flagellar motor protein MotB [Desulfonatronospira sp.]